MFAKVFPRAMETSLHRGDARVESFGNLGVAPALLHQSEQRPILWPQLAERVTQGITIGPNNLQNIASIDTDIEAHTFTELNLL